jgi:hypothetical protein
MRSLFVLTLGAAMSCGSLVDDRFVGDVRLNLSSDVKGDPAPFIDVKDQLRLSLFYLRAPGNPRSIDELQEHEATRTVLNPPASLRWSIYDAPEERHYLTSPSGKRYALGVALAYVDTNDDGRRSEGEPQIGEAPITAVISVETGLDRDESPTGSPLEAGFYTVSRPLWCAPRPTEPAPTSPDCGVPLSAACTSDAECGAGTCLTLGPWPWPRGTCALPSTSTCVPENAHLWRNHQNPSLSYWLRECATTADCRDPYQCDRGYKVCLPTGNLGLRVEPNFRIMPICQPMMP